MKRRVAWGVLTLLVIAAIGLFGFGPGIVERGQNELDRGPLPAVSDRARALR